MLFHYLVKLPAHLPAPYRDHKRETDQYGYAAFDGNYYWVPGTDRDEVKVLEYSDRLKIYQHRKCVAEYPLPADGVTNALFSPEGMPKPARQPKNRTRLTQEEEKRLRAMSRSNATTSAVAQTGTTCQSDSGVTWLPTTTMAAKMTT